MIKKLTVVLGVLAWAGGAHALDWQRLHTAADSISLDLARQTVQAQPHAPDKLYVLGLVYLREHQERRAQKIFERMLRADSQSMPALWGLAEVRRRNNELEEGGEILEDIIETVPEFAPAYISLAYVRYTQGEFKEAIKLALTVKNKGRGNVDLSSYTRAYLIYAGAKGMLASRGGPLSKLVNGAQVLPNLKRAEKLQPDSPAVLFGLGSFYFLAPAIAGGNLNKAQKYLERAVEIDPLFADAYVRLAQVARAQDDKYKYQLYLDKALAIDAFNRLAQDEINKICKFNCVTVEK